MTGAPKGQLAEGTGRGYRCLNCKRYANVKISPVPVLLIARSVTSFVVTRSVSLETGELASPDLRPYVAHLSGKFLVNRSGAIDGSVFGLGVISGV